MSDIIANRIYTKLSGIDYIPKLINIFLKHHFDIYVTRVYLL